MQLYYLICSLPPLDFDHPPPLSVDSYLTVASDLMSEKELKSIEVLLRYIDIENLYAVWTKNPWNAQGQWSEKELKTRSLLQEKMPGYVSAYLQRYHDLDKKIRHFGELVSLYFRKELKEAHGFLKQYLEFEWRLRIAMAFLRAQLLERDLKEELQFYDFQDPFMDQIMGQKEEKEALASYGFEEVAVFYETSHLNPVELDEKLDRFRFHQIENMVEEEHFSFDKALAYLVCLIILQRRNQRNLKQGKQIVEEIIQGN